MLGCTLPHYATEVRNVKRCYQGDQHDRCLVDGDDEYEIYLKLGEELRYHPCNESTCRWLIHMISSNGAL